MLWKFLSFPLPLSLPPKWSSFFTDSLAIYPQKCLGRLGSNDASPSARFPIAENELSKVWPLAQTEHALSLSHDSSSTNYAENCHNIAAILVENISPHFATRPRDSGLGDEEKEEGQKFVRNQIDPSSRQVYVAKLGRMGSSPSLLFLNLSCLAPPPPLSPASPWSERGKTAN